MDAQRTPRLRPTARAIVFDSHHRVLLLKHVGESEELPAVWVTPGGGVEDGESFEEAVVRELWEEVGLETAELGPCVWLWRGIISFRGTHLNLLERYFVCQTKTFEITSGNREQLERELIAEHRWWTIDEIECSSEVFVPRELGRLLRPLVLGEFPRRPLLVEG